MEFVLYIILAWGITSGIMFIINFATSFGQYNQPNWKQYVFFWLVGGPIAWVFTTPIILCIMIYKKLGD